MAVAFADAMTSKSWVMIEGGGGPKYVGPDHSSLAGAKALARRLEQFWLSKGTPKKFDVYVAGREAHATELVYGVKEVTSAPPPRVKTLPFGPEQYEAAMKIVREVLKDHPGVDHNVIIQAACRTRKISAARWACIRAVCVASIFSSRYQLGRFFNITPSSVERALAGTGVGDLSKGEKRGKGRRVCKRKMVTSQ